MFDVECWMFDVQRGHAEHRTFNIEHRTPNGPLTPALSPAYGGEGVNGRLRLRLRLGLGLGLGRGVGEG
jgi:hypothetical protein